MRLVLLTFPVNTFFNYIMIFGKFGLPSMGGAGAGAGTAVTCWLLFIAFRLGYQKIKGYGTTKAFSLV
jgi:MATE family multidrug resistance protein